MNPATPRDPFHVRSPGAGPCYVYVLPCAYEDILKLGISRDPLSRMQALHRRYFEFFDLSHGILVETETVRDARDLELALGRIVKLHRAPSPLVVRRQAAGHTEWYRGAYTELACQAEALSANGYVVRIGLHQRLREGLLGRSNQLFSWAEAMLSALELEPGDPLPAPIRDVLDAHAALGIDLVPLLPEAMWHRYHRSAP